MSVPGDRRLRRRRGGLALTIGLLVVGVLASTLPPDRQSQIEAIVRATALFPIIELHRASAERTAVGRRVTALQLERDRLVETLQRLRGVVQQTAELSDLAMLEEPDLGSVRPAMVYPGRPRVGDPNVFVLRGEGLADLEFPVGVFTGNGLVGVARAAHGIGARGEFWSHTDFRVSVVTADGLVSGIARAVRPEGEQPILLLEGAPFQGDIEPGTSLLTTGIGGVYPPGIQVGVVRELADAEAGWMKSYYVEPAVRPAQIMVVLAWDRPSLDSLPRTEADTETPEDSTADSTAVDGGDR